MWTTEALHAWVQRGVQKHAVIRSLTKPMTLSELHDRARQHAPKLQLRDVWALLHQFQEHGLTEYIYKAPLQGSIYYLTETGKAIVRTFHRELVSVPSLQWSLYSYVVCSKARCELLHRLCQPRFDDRAGMAPSELRKVVRDHTPMSMSQVMRTLRQLRTVNLVTRTPATLKRFRSWYHPTTMGRAINDHYLR